MSDGDVLQVLGELSTQDMKPSWSLRWRYGHISVLVKSQNQISCQNNPKQRCTMLFISIKSALNWRFGFYVQIGLLYTYQQWSLNLGENLVRRKNSMWGCESWLIAILGSVWGYYISRWLIKLKGEYWKKKYDEYLEQKVQQKHIPMETQVAY